MERGRVRRSAVVLALLCLVGCQALEDVLPTKPAEPTPTPTPSAPVSIPVILPQPTPTPVLGIPPAPTPAPGATPTPAPAPTPGASSCGLPGSNPANPVCTDDRSRLYAKIDAALTTVTQKRPELFNLNNKVCENCYYVKDVGGYIAEVKKELAKQGICTAGGDEEIGVKNTNEFSEQYDILLASQHMRRGPGSYRGVCRPALF
jgi:hypothetical protein